MSDLMPPAQPAPHIAAPPPATTLTDWLRTLNSRRLQLRRLRRDKASYDVLVAREQAELRALAGHWPQRVAALGPSAPLLSLLWLPEAADEAGWPALHRSLAAQAHGRWELLTDAPAAAHTTDARVRCLPSGAAPGATVAQRYNHLLAQAAGSHVLLLRGADQPAAPHALLLWAEAVQQFNQPPVLYADEDCIDRRGRRHSPHFKCGWNQELQRAAHSLGRAWLVRTDLARQAGGLDATLPLPAAEQVLVLRAADAAPNREPVHVPHLLLHRAAAPGVAMPEVPAPGTPAQARAVQACLQARGVAASVTPSPLAGLHVRYALPAPPPLVSLVIPTRNGLALLRQCVDSVLQRTRYPHYELLIVDNGSDDPDTLAWMADIQRRDARVRVRRDDRPFNYAQLNNDALVDCRGSVIGLLNNDTEVISPDWLDEMVGQACRPDVGAVGARLWYGQRTLQHGGVVVGLGGHAGHVHLGLRPDEPGYAGRAWLAQEFSAVTAACLVMRRAVFEAVGGLDADALAVDLNDVDLCLKLRRAGWRVVWTPFAELFHHESATRGKSHRPEQLARLAAERATFDARWGEWLRADPAYHPALTLRHTPFTASGTPRVSLMVPWTQGPQPGRAAWQAALDREAAAASSPDEAAQSACWARTIAA